MSDEVVPREGLRKLAFAVIVRGVRDALGRDHACASDRAEAYDFVTGEVAGDMAESIGLSTWPRWLRLLRDQYEDD